MTFSVDQLHQAVSQGIITQEQFEKLVTEADAVQARSPHGRFDMPHAVLYFGALVVISALTWFNTNGWDKFTDIGVTLISASMAVLFIMAGTLVWYVLKQKVSGGLFFVMAVCLVPLIVYGILKSTGNLGRGKAYGEFFRQVDQDFVLMETATIAAGFVTMLFIRYPLLTAPIAVAFWFLSMDLAPKIYGRSVSVWTGDEWKTISLVVGSGMIVIAYILDRATEDDFSAWLYFFGLLAAWSALTLMHSGSEWKKFMYFLLNLGLMGTAIFLNRRAFMFFGVLGVLAYLNDLAWNKFKDSTAFPFVLAAMGLAVMFAGITFFQKRKAVQDWIDEYVPLFVTWLIPERARP